MANKPSKEALKAAVLRAMQRSLVNGRSDRKIARQILLDDALLLDAFAAMRVAEAAEAAAAKRCQDALDALSDD